MTTLLLDENPSDRMALAKFLGTRFSGPAVPAPSIEECGLLAETMGNLDVFIAAVPPGREEEVLAMRDRLRQRFPRLAVMLLAGSDLTPFYGRISREEAVFYKPVDLPAVREWLAGLFPSSVLEPSAPGLEIPPVPEEAPAEAPRPPELEGTPPFVAGAVLGDYEILEFVARGGTSDRFVAMQRSVDRKVGLRMLRADFHDYPETREAFLAQARAQAAVKHPRVAPVYEAHDTEQALFYTQELIDGVGLDEAISQDRHFTEEESLKALRSAAETFRDLYEQNVPLLPIWPEHVFLLPDGTVKLANTAQDDTAENRIRQAEQLKNLAKCFHPLLDRDALSNETLPNLLFNMSGTGKDDDEAITSWDDLLKEIRFIEARWRELSGGLTPRKLAGYAAALVGGVVVLVALAVSLVSLYKVASGSVSRISDARMIRIPAGKFLYQEGQEAELPEYFIDEFEVTIGQYAAFLAHLDSLPEAERTRYDHPDQPGFKAKTHHRPVGWDAYFRAAKEKRIWTVQEQGRTHGIRMDLNLPVVLVDWWDAHAFAASKGRRLPTEQEWEKAARGRQGNLYPWGQELDWTQLNAGSDYVEPASEEAETVTPAASPTPTPPPVETAAAPSATTDAPAAPAPAAPASTAPAGMKPDGHPYWCEVDVFEGDTSPYNVRGMAGNASEWTGTWAPHPTKPGAKVPVRRGASFATRSLEELKLTTRFLALDPNETSLRVGFRTAADTAPSAEP